MTSPTTSANAGVKGSRFGQRPSKLRDPGKEERYWQRKADGECTTCGVKLPDDHETQQCDKHQAKSRESTRGSMARSRERAIDAGLCADGCGRNNDGLYRCRLCYLKSGRLKPATHGVNNRVNVDSRTSVDSDGRSRYHGQGKRGAPTAEVLVQQEEMDLVSAERLIARGIEALRIVRSPEIRALPRIQKEGAMREALSYFDRASRTLDSVLDRHGYGREATDRLERGHSMRRHGGAGRGGG